MVNIRIGESNSVYTLDMSGHAVDKEGYMGDSEVCAACSAIAYMVLGWASNNTCTEFTESYGEMHIIVDASDMTCGQAWEIAAVWEAAEIGLCQIAQKYPEYVSIEDK